MASMIVALIVGALAALAFFWFALQLQLLKTALAAYQGHRPAEAVKRARRCLALRPLAAIRPLAHQVLGLAHSSLGELAEAETCFRTALQSPSPAHQARSAVLLAGLAHRDGRLAEARELFLRGREDPTVRRDAGVGLVELSLNEGDFDRARQELQGTRATLALQDPASERQSRGLLDFLAGLVELEEGRAAAARALVDQAAPAVAGIPLLAFRIEAVRALLDAMEHPSDALGALKDVDARLAACGEDRSSRLAAELLLARGYVHAGAYVEAERVLRAALVSDPPRVTLPEIHVLLADCAAGRQDPAGAARALEEAIRSGVETRWAQSARRRLAGPLPS